MDLLHLLLDSDKSLASTCLLCFERDRNTFDINTKFEIHNQYRVKLVTIAEMLQTLFPYQAFLFHQVCDDCSDLITQLYILLSKQKLKCDLLHNMLKVIDRKIDEILISPKENGKVYINLKELTSLNLQDSKPIDAAESYNGTTFMDTPLTRQMCSNNFETAEHIKLYEGDHKKMLKASPDSPETFQNTDQLTHGTHKKKYKRNKIYQYCKDCTYKTLSTSSLKAHINKHHLETRPHVCQVCYKGFYNKSNLNEHIKTHSNQRNEICDVCGCSFLHKKNLEEHLRLHSDTRPYECSVCNKKFVTSGRRSDHIKRSHMERTECCLICNKKYSLKKELTRHMNNVHLRM